MLALDLGGAGDWLAHLVPGALVGIAVIAIVWLIAYAVTTLSGQDHDGTGRS